MLLSEHLEEPNLVSGGLWLREEHGLIAQGEWRTKSLDSSLTTFAFEIMSSIPLFSSIQEDRCNDKKVASFVTF